MQQMQQDRINQTRYWTLIVVLGLSFGLCLGAALIARSRGDTNWIALSVFWLAALANLGLIPLAMAARRRSDRAALQRIALTAIAVGFVAILQRVLWYMFVYWPEQPAANPFRQVFNFLPFFYIAVVVLLQTPRALKACWAGWAIISALAVLGLWRAGVSLQTEGALSLLLWLLLANPLFILLLHALPQYESALAESESEIAHLRERTELTDRLAETERRFRLVTDGLQVGVWDRWVGPPVRRWWSPRFYELIGYTPDELPASEEQLKALLHPDDRERVWKIGTEQLENGDIMDVDFRLNTRHRGYRWFNSHAKADRDPGGHMVRLAGSITDIHEQRTAADALRLAQAELTRLAYRDTLTDLHNRRYFEEHFQREWERARRNRQPLALLLIDLDHFKAYNDRYGHPAGDICLVEVGNLLTRCANRATDIVARLGGEEFGVVLPDATAQGAEDVARRIQALLLESAIPHDDSPNRIMTLSVGVAAIEGPEGPGPAELFEQADKALYEAKHRGRNGIVRHGEKPVAAAARAGLG